MVLENKLGLTTSTESAREEERLTKIRAKKLIQTGGLFALEAGTVKGLAQIHKQLFEEIYDFQGRSMMSTLPRIIFSWLLGFFRAILAVH